MAIVRNFHRISTFWDSGYSKDSKGEWRLKRSRVRTRSGIKDRERYCCETAVAFAR